MSEVHVVNSGTAIPVRESDVYVGSEPRRSDWGQPPASHYYFIIIGENLYGQQISGMYYGFRQGEAALVLDQQLRAEFDAWESASDEALILFEEGLD